VADYERRQAEHYEPENAGPPGERNALSANVAELENHLRRERAPAERVLIEQGAMTVRIRDVLEPQVERLTGQVSALQRENARLTKARERLQAENAAMRLELKVLPALKAELKVVTVARDELERKKAEWYEPELARLKSHVEHSKFEKETQVLRRRVMAYADQARRIAGSIAVLERKLAELEHLRDSWYVPELARLSEVISQYEKTKREWFEPQLDSRAAHIASLEDLLRSRDSRIRELEEKSAARVEKSDAGSEKPAGRIFRFRR
jgi:hypothetical protein